MRTIIEGHKLNGNIDIIPSKSYLHRAIIAASLANGVSRIDNVYYSLDVLATINACISFGAKIEQYDNYLVIHGTKVKKIKEEIDANESGSTLRFMIPVMLLQEEEITFVGKPGLAKRPLDEYFHIFNSMKIKYEKKDNYLPLKLQGKLKPGKYELEGNVSSQFVTGLLLALPLLEGNSKILIKKNLESKPYVDITLDILSHFGIDIINNNYQEFIIKGNQQYKATNYVAEGDYSQAAFFLTANAFGNVISVKNLNIKSIQGDKAILRYLALFGLNFEYQDGVFVKKECVLHHATIDLGDAPDLGPILFTLASIIEGKTHFINTNRLKYKESDRILSMQEELEKIGAKFTVLDNEVYIEGTTILDQEYTFDSHNDHRVQMSLSMLATMINSKVTILNSDSINKTYPTFYEDYKKLGGVSFNE